MLSDVSYYREKIRNSDSKISDLKFSGRLDSSADNSFNVILLGAEYERLKRVLIDMDREVEDYRLRGDINRKSIIDKEIRELNARFSTEKENLDREITNREREIAELRSRNYQLSSSSSQNLNKSQEIRVLRDAVSQKHEEIERLKKSTNSPYRPAPGDSERVTKLSTDNERLRMELREKDH